MEEPIDRIQVRGPGMEPMAFEARKAYRTVFYTVPGGRRESYVVTEIRYFPLKREEDMNWEERLTAFMVTSCTRYSPGSTHIDDG